MLDRHCIALVGRACDKLVSALRTVMPTTRTTTSRASRRACRHGVVVQRSGATPIPAHAITLRVDYKRMNTFFADYAKNISKGGTFIRTSKPLDVGHRVRLRPVDPRPAATSSSSSARSCGPSTRTARPKSSPAGMGIRFKFADEAERQAARGLRREADVREAREPRRREAARQKRAYARRRARARPYVPGMAAPRRWSAPVRPLRLTRASTSRTRSRASRRSATRSSSRTTTRRARSRTSPTSSAIRSSSRRPRRRRRPTSSASPACTSWPRRRRS